MNTKTIKELCGEAGLKCEAYRVPLTDVLCLSILCPTERGSAVQRGTGFTDPVCELVEVMLDQTLDTTWHGADNVGAYESRDAELRSLLALLHGGRAAFKTVAGERRGLLYWPSLAWEE